MCTKKWLPVLFIILFFATGARAQITLTAANFTNTHVTDTDTVIFSFYSPTPVVIPALPPATNAIWDMTGAVADTPFGWGIASKPYDPPDAVNFPGSKFAVLTLAGLAVTNFNRLFDVFQQRAFTSAAYEEYGMHLPSLPLTPWPSYADLTDDIYFADQNIVHSSPAAIIKFPATYNSAWSYAYRDSVSYTLTISELGYSNVPAYTIKYITETDTVVGWGRMKVKKPNGDRSNYIDVLQVQKRLREVDSVFVNGSASSAFVSGVYGPQGRNRYEYTQAFYMAGNTIPLATVVYLDSAFTDPQYAITLSWSQYTDPETVPAPAQASAINLYPNPVTGNTVTLDIPDAMGNWAYELVNMVGMQVATGAITASNNQVHEQIALPASLTPGMYYMKLNNDGKEVAVRSLDIVK